MLGGNKMPDIKNLRLFYVLTKYPLVYANASVKDYNLLSPPPQKIIIIQK